MTKFKGSIINNQPAAAWKAIYAACRRFQRFIVSVDEYNEQTSISDQQRKYWHAMPITLYSKHTGYTLKKSEWLLKRECGEHFFMHELKEDENRRGQILFECLNPYCRNIFQLPHKIGEVYVCPNEQCRTPNIRIFFMLSKTELSIKDFNDVLENTWEYMEGINCHCQKPNPRWKLEKKDDVYEFQRNR